MLVRISRNVMILLGFLTVSLTVNAKGPEWSYSFENDGFTMTVRVSACYEDDTKSSVSINWYGTRSGSSISADSSCGCGEGLKVNDAVTITPNSFADLIENGITTDLRSYACVPVE